MSAATSSSPSSWSPSSVIQLEGEDGDQLAVQFTWTATVTQALGTLQGGTRLVSYVAAFYVFHDGLVLRQSSYDCYEPLAAPNQTVG